MENKIVHKRSSSITNGTPKLPNSSQLEYGEIAINYADGGETISIKNNANEIVEFKPKDYFATKSHTHVSSAITDSISASTSITSGATGLVQGKAVHAYAAPKSHSHVASAITGGTFDIARIPTGTTNITVSRGDHSHDGRYYTETEINTKLSGKSDTGHSHGIINLMGNVTGTGKISSGETDVNITATVVDNSHKHESSNVTDSISASSGITSGATGLVQGKAVHGYAAPKSHSHDDRYYTESEIDTKLSGKSNTGHTHVSSAITDSISASSGITSGATGLVQGKAVHGYAAPKSHSHDDVYSKTSHSHGKITLSGDVTGEATIGSGTTAVSITTTVANDSHNHKSSNITDSISASSGITSGATGLVQGRAVHGYAAPKSHTHDDRYYTESEIDTKLSGKSNTGHTHVSSSITDSISASSAITSGETGLVQGKAVHGFVKSEISNLVNGAPETLDTLGELADALRDNKDIVQVLENAIANKADAGHTHVSSAITDSISASTSITSGATGLVQGKAVHAYAAPKSHNHNDVYYTETEINNKLSGKSDTGHTHVSSSITDSISASTSITSAATGLVQGRAVHAYASPKSHNHDDRYYTETEINTKLAGKSDTGHTHDGRYYTESEIDTKLLGKSDTGHTHVSSAITDSISASSAITSGATGLVQGKAVHAYAAPKSHTHDDRYYTETEIDTKLAGKSNTGHTHVSSAITDSISASSAITSEATGLVQGKVVYAYAAPKSHNHDNRYYTETEIDTKLDGKSNVGHTHDDRYSKTSHSHGKITLSGNVTGEATIGSGTTDVNIIATVANDSHSHKSSNISDSISASTSITSGATGLVQGKAVYNYAAPKSHNHDDVYYTETEVNNKLAGKSDTGHTHVSSVITDSISASSAITSGATGLVQGKAVHAYAAPKSHSHDDRYYTESEMNTKLSGKSDTGHTHVSSVITDSISASSAITSGATGLVQGKAVHGFVKTEISNLINGAPGTLDTLGELADALRDNKDIVQVLENSIANKADAGHTHVSSAITDSISASSGITSGATGLVQGKAVHAYAAPKSHSHVASAITGGTFDIARIPTGTTSTTVSRGDHNHDNRYYTETEVNNKLASKSDTGHTHVSSAITDSISASTSITSGATGLVQGKAVHAYAAPKSHNHTSSNISDSISASTSITSGATGLVQGKAVHAYAAPKSHSHDDVYYTETEINTKLSGKSDTEHSHGKITLSGDVTGEATIGSGTTAVNITTTVANDSHNHKSSNISDSISASTSITSGATGLVQGRAVYNYAAPKSHNHKSSNVTDSISASTSITSGATGLVQGKAVHGYAAPKSHTHDDRYYTETEIDTKLAGKSGTGHTHDDRYYTETEINTKLAGKSDTGHTHGGVYQPIGSYVSLSNSKNTLPSGTFSLSGSNTGGQHGLVISTLNDGSTYDWYLGQIFNPNNNASVGGNESGELHLNGSNIYLNNTNINDVFASSSHNHNSVYSEIGHNHNGIYSSFGHNHDTAYATKSHESTDDTYGLATTGVYGHVKISNGDVNTVGSSKGLVAGMDHSHGNYSLTGHTHDDRYYTESEINTKLAGKSNTGHTHVSSAITDSISASSSINSGATGLVQGRAVHAYAAPKSHNHTSSNVTDSISASTSITSAATGLVQGKAVYNYAAKRITKAQCSSTETLEPNTFYSVPSSIRSLTLTLKTPSDSNILSVYMCQFTASSSGCTLTLPSSVKWANGITPTIKANKTYQLSIVNNLAVLMCF